MKQKTYGGSGVILLKNKQEIILDSMNGVSQREIARKYGVSRNTVIKYVNEYQLARKKLFDPNNEPEDMPFLISAVTEKPKYDIESRKKVKLTEEVLAIINTKLKENEDKKTKGMQKQIMKAVDIHEFILEKGIDISYSTVCNTIRELNDSGKEAYIRQEYKDGDVCEFDWGYVKLYIGHDKLETFQMAVFTTAKGNYRYCRIYRSQKMEFFLDVHTKFFEHIGGSFRTVVYDNLRTAVRKFVSCTEKEPTEEFLKLSLYYGFTYRFCNTRRGNEKGHVERSVEYVRRKVFSKRDTFLSVEEAEIYLEEELFKLNKRKKVQYNDKSPYDILEIEKKYLLPHMPVYNCHRVMEARVDKYSTITIDQNHYSVEDTLVGKFITAFIYPERIVCFYHHKEVATHRRVHGNHEWALCIHHYTKTLSRKPGALASSTAFKQSSNELQKIYQDYYSKNPKDFIALIEYIANVGFSTVLKAIQQLQELSPLDLSTDKIKMICERMPLSEHEKKGDTKIIEASKDNINQIIAIYGIQTTHYKEEAIL